MANRVSREKIEEMFRVYVDRESIEDVSTKCGVSHRTAERYRVVERWTERLVEIRRNAQEEADYTIVDAMADSLRSIRSYKGKLAAAIEREGSGMGRVVQRARERDYVTRDYARFVRFDSYADHFGVRIEHTPLVLGEPYSSMGTGGSPRAVISKT